DGVHGYELFVTDGSFGGTVRLTNPQPCGCDPEVDNLMNVGGILYFTEDDGIHGREVWKSDGTPAGTVMVQDLFEGYGGSYPGHLTNAGGTLFFDADDGIHGDELWSLVPDIPVLNAPSSIKTNLNTSITLSGLNTISVNESGNNAETLTLKALHGTLKF